MSQFTTRLRRAMTAAAAAGLLAGLVPAAASAATPAARDITKFACPTNEVPDPGFTDDDDSIHRHAIACIVWYELAGGTSSTQYSPQRDVNRGQMATFLKNLLVAGGVTMPSNPPDAFDDDDDTTHEKAINELAALGVVNGTSDTTYSPHASVTRGQMATFLNNAYAEITGARLTSSQDYFTDDTDTTHEDNINAVAEAGIAAGKSQTRYAPDDPVLRDQMASFLARETDLLVEEDHVSKPAPASVVLDSSTVRQGQQLTGKVLTSGDTEIRAVEADGCGLENEAVTLSGTENSFSITIPVTQPAGPCTVTFTITTADSGEIVDREPITVTELAAQTEGPELVSVSTPAVGENDTQVTLTFTFDETLNPNSTPAAGDFKLYSAAAQPATGTNVTLSGSSVQVTFSRAQYDAATTAAVPAAAVEDSQHIPNPEGSIALKKSGITTSDTAAPDLIDVRGPTTGVTKVQSTEENWTFEFDEPAYRVGTAEDFHLVLSDGTVRDGTTGAQNPAATTDPSCPEAPECRRTITFTFEDTHVGLEVVRGYIEAGTMSTEPQTDSIGTEGTANPQQAHPVRGGGPTPYLTDISIDAQENTVTYVFSRGVRVNDTDPLQSGTQSDRFRAYRANGSEVASSSATASGNTVVARFSTGITGSDPIPDTTVGGSIDQDAVTTTAGATLTNRVDELADPLEFGPGRTAAPDLIGVTRSVSGSNTVLTFIFDQTVVRTENSTQRFTIYQENGQRDTLRLNSPPTGTNECSTSGSRVQCQASSSSTLGQLIDSAVLAGVMQGTVEDSSETHRNYETSRPIA